MIVELYYEWGFFEEAIDLLEDLLVRFPLVGEIITMMAEINVELKMDDVAIDLLNSIEPDDPFYVASLVQLADLYQAQGLFERSEERRVGKEGRYRERPYVYKGREGRRIRNRV